MEERLQDRACDARPVGVIVQITERCRLLYGSPRALQELKIYSFKRYQDHRRFLAMERAYVYGKIWALAR